MNHPRKPKPEVNAMKAYETPEVELILMDDVILASEPGEVIGDDFS